MKTRYDSLGMETAWSGFSLQQLSDPTPTRLERRLRDIETGAPALNLSLDAVHLAAEIAALEPTLDHEQRIALILLITISLAALEEGSTRFPVTGPDSAGPMRRLLVPLCGNSFGAGGAESMKVAIETLLSSRAAAAIISYSATDYKPLIYLPPFIYLQRIRAAETALARKLADLMTADVSAFKKANIADLLLQLSNHPATVRGGPFDLSGEQRNAVALAVSAPLTIISGGPGTGKTSIVVAILRLLVRMGLQSKDIALAAPTGKAAYRIGESIREGLSKLDDPNDATLFNDRPEPTTVHRLLGYSPTLRRFRHHRNNPISASVVIIDEGSMLDLDLMAHLLDALRPRTRLVILGDADQLPSVAAGAVFRDLRSGPDDWTGPLAPTSARLSRTYRTDMARPEGDAIFRLASAINAGDASAFESRAVHDGALSIRRESVEDITFHGAEWLDEPSGRYGTFLEKWYLAKVRSNDEYQELTNRVYTISEQGFAAEECESLRMLLRTGASARILCVTRVFDSGAERINGWLHRRASRDASVLPERVPFLIGEPVVVLRNDYDRMLFNGDQGLVLRVRRSDYDATPMAVFPKGDNFVAFRIDALKDDLEICYAMTVHKAQGSEFDSVAVIMPENDIPILTREILYTAVSRARASVTIIGAQPIVSAAISRKIERCSGVPEQLALFLSQTPRV